MRRIEQITTDELPMFLQAVKSPKDIASKTTEKKHLLIRVLQHCYELIAKVNPEGHIPHCLMFLQREATLIERKQLKIQQLEKEYNKLLLEVHAQLEMHFGSFFARKVFQESLFYIKKQQVKI